MQIGGLQKFSVIDYPGKVAAVIFTQGCNFRCPYCYNCELVIPELFHPAISEEYILAFLKKREGHLQGVVITGGEPTLQKDLIPFLYKIKQFGYPIKVDTNGSNPLILARMIDLKLVQYIAMDIKASLDNYHRATGIRVNIDNIKESIDVILNANLPYEFRTTLVKPVCSSRDIYEIFSVLKDASKYILQEFIPSEKVLNKKLLRESHFTEQEVCNLQAKWQRGVV